MTKQIFFRSDEEAEARAAAKETGNHLYEVFDKRSKNPTPRMFVLGEHNTVQLTHSKLWKRMWRVRRLVDE